MAASAGKPEVVVIGSGPNGLAAAVTMARHGFPVTVLEAGATVGGATRTLELTLPGFLHDACSAIHPLAEASPCFRALPLSRFGLTWIYPDAALAHPFDDGTAVLLHKEIPRTVETLDAGDRSAYQQLFEPLLEDWELLAPELLAPLHFPTHPLLMAGFGIHGLRSAAGLAENRFQKSRAKALFAGLSAHSFLPLDRAGSAAFGLILGVLGHLNGWPFPKGGAQQITMALTGYLESLGGKIVTGEMVRSLDGVSGSGLVFMNVTPRQALTIAGARLTPGYRQHLENYRYGPGVFKLDWALSGPIPWRAAECRRAATVHLGGTLEEIAAGEKEVWQGGHPEHPFVLLAQQSLFDPSRAPEGKQTGWAYCHVPNGSSVDMTERIERQVERFAPGFRELILARSVRDCAGFERYNANCVGGDINGGVQDLRQILARPVIGPHPYATSDSRIFLCSSSTPPGGGVHGMCGYHAAQLALERFAR
ncbi:FAD-dependent oxidoreductase [Geomonas silvestris]|uniref:FAD-dependent oxidoreductase n=1 Tax=Geomonas silvestris TaxID=2740184 RepID=A0A6V8MJY0_9BACT|nr:NAD(P)/FAD-dependent oxidoreductase [Geomonas silvestris]GFO60300.1 FAD-dependent oxidoreductase [Geomonas silvestris]